jgi:hypothetical protein
MVPPGIRFPYFWKAAATWHDEHWPAIGILVHIEYDQLEDFFAVKTSEFVESGILRPSASIEPLAFVESTWSVASMYGTVNYEGRFNPLTCSQRTNLLRNSSGIFTLQVVPSSDDHLFFHLF